MNYRFAGVFGFLVLVSTTPPFMVSELPRGDKAELRSQHGLSSALRPKARQQSRELGHYLSLPIDSEQNRKGIAAVKEAIALADKQKYAAALESYDRALRLMPSLGDWLKLFSAGVAATAGDTAEVNRRIGGLDALLVDEWAWRARVRGYRNAEDRRGALRIAHEATNAGTARKRAEGWRAVGEVELTRNDSTAARVAFRNAIAALPYSDVALDAARMLSELPQLQASDHLSIGRTYMSFGNATRGLAGLTRYLGSPDADADTMMRVRFEVGRAHFAADKFADAERVLRLVTSNNAVGAEAAFLAARAAYRAGRPEDGRAGFASVVQRFGGSDAATRALFMLGDLDHDARNTAGAEISFRRAAETGGTTETAGIAHMRLVTIALARADTAEAIRRLEAYRAIFKTGPRNQQASYWLGKLHAAGDRDVIATDRFTAATKGNRFSYYGLRAAELLADGAAPELAPDPVTAPALHRTVAAAVARLDVLHDLGWTEAAAFELRRVKEYFAAEPTALLALAEELIERERTGAGITIGQELLRSEKGMPSRRLLRTVYPMPHRQLIFREAKRYGIDPFFMAALIRQESAFNPKATSGAGAMGLMQVMPSTAKALARPLGIRRFKSTMLHQADTNVRIGARFLADMVRSWNGRVDYVLAAYNAGPSRVARWRRLPEARDPELFMERIPFDETRDYVRVVQLNKRIYEILYGPQKPLSAVQN